MKVSARILLSTELVPYFSDEATMKEVMESEISDEIYPLVLDYFLKDDHFSDSIENQLESLEKRLESETRDEKNKIIYTLSAFEKGREVLIDYLFKTKDSLEFLRIYNEITLEDTPENREKVKRSLKKWSRKPNQPGVEDVISLHYKTLFNWGDKSVLKYIDNDIRIGRDCLENALVTLKVEGDNAWNIFKEHSPIKPDRFGYYDRIELYPYKRFSYGHNGNNIDELRRYVETTAYGYRKSKIKESYPFIQELKGIKEYSFPLDIISKDQLIPFTRGVKKGRSYHFYSEGIILLEAGEKVKLDMLDHNRESLGSAYLENSDSVTCWRSFRIETDGIKGMGTDIGFYIVSDNRDELTIPELQFYIKPKKHN